MKYFFHLKIQLLIVTAKSDKNRDPVRIHMSIHWFGSLEPDPHCGKKLGTETNAIHKKAYLKEKSSN
jgi:hypothetical protein